MYISRFIETARQSYRPLAILHPQRLKQNLSEWITHLPHVKPFFAMKSFNHPVVLDLMAKHGGNFTGYDVASPSEISQIVKYQKPIIYTHPIRTRYDIEFAKEHGINWLVSDSLTQNNLINKYYPEAKVIWRIKADERCSDVKFNCKFGADEAETEQAINQTKQLCGFSFHVGSNCKNIEQFVTTMNDIITKYLPLSSRASRKIEVVDIGGGFTGPDDLVALKNIGANAFETFKNRRIQVIAEPGRFFSRNTITLLTKVIGVKHNFGSNAEVYINDSIYNTFSGKVFDHQTFYPIPLYYHHPKELLVRCNIWGNTCDGEDIILRDALLPLPKENDVIMWENMGAYSLSSAIDGFNGFREPEVVIDEESD